jgi:hypothetical protein
MVASFGPRGDSAVRSLTQSSQTFALGSGSALRLMSMQSGQTAWYIKFGTSGAVTVSVTDGMRVIPGGVDIPVVIPFPPGSTHYAILAEGSPGDVLATTGEYEEGAFKPAGASQVVTVTTTPQVVALPALDSISPSIRLVANTPAIDTLWVKLGNAAVSGSVTTSMRVQPGSVENPTIIPVTNGETHINIFCEGVGGAVVLTGGGVDPVTPFPLTRSGDRWGVMTYVGPDGVMEVGKFLDFHDTDGDTSDFSARITSSTTAFFFSRQLYVDRQGGAEGGEITLQGPASGTTIAGDYTIDVAGNQARFFESGGTFRGAHIDITQCLAGASVPLIGKHRVAAGTIVNAATLDLVLTALTGYRSFELQLDRLVPANDDVDLWARVSTNGGSSYDAAAGNYRWALAWNRSDSTTAFARNSGSAVEIVLCGTQTATESVSNVAAEGGCSAVVRLIKQNDTAVWPVLLTQSTWVEAAGGQRLYNSTAAGARNNAQDTDALRIMFESGNIATGQYTLWGIL